MKRSLRILGAAALVAVLAAAPARAITFGELDGDGHPNVGSMVAILDGVPESFCTGTLVAPDVFVTASHCTAALAFYGVAPDEVFVTFDPVVDATSTLLGATYYTHPLYGSGGFNDTYDVAVLVLDSPAAGITPARLPEAGLLDRLSLRDQRFVTVGYGTVREDKTKGPAPLFWDPQRRVVDQGFLALTKSWLHLSMNPSTGSGGTCYGDSGGPHFLGTSDVVVSVTVTGDMFCRATDVTYRLDTPSARDFIGQFVDLP